MTPRLYPLGIQTFEEIRENDMLYIDKTEYIYRMTHVSDRGGGPLLLLHPSAPLRQIAVGVDLEKLFRRKEGAV